MIPELEWIDQNTSCHTDAKVISYNQGTGWLELIEDVNTASSSTGVFPQFSTTNFPLLVVWQKGGMTEAVCIVHL